MSGKNLEGINQCQYTRSIAISSYYTATHTYWQNVHA